MRPTPSGCGRKHAGRGTAQEAFDFWYGAIPADDPFWTLPIGDPGPSFLFEFPVYTRGAMTVHQLRLAVGDRDFFRILRGWAKRNEDENVTTDDFIAYAERVSGEELSELFEAWLFSDTKPVVASSTASAPRARLPRRPAGRSLSATPPTGSGASAGTASTSDHPTERPARRGARRYGANTRKGVAEPCRRLQTRLRVGRH